MDKIERYHWVNMYLGILDGAFTLTEEEQHDIIKEIKLLLDRLNIPKRSNPIEIPSALALEVRASFYTNLLNKNIKRGNEANLDQENILKVSIEAWRDPFLNWLILAYPDLDGEERIIAANTFEKLLKNLRLPNRVPYYLPDDVIKAHLSGS
jgi:hypothetical protein